MAKEVHTIKKDAFGAAIKVIMDNEIFKKKPEVKDDTKDKDAVNAFLLAVESVDRKNESKIPDEIANMYNAMVDAIEEKRPIVLEGTAAPAKTKSEAKAEKAPAKGKATAKKEEPKKEEAKAPAKGKAAPAAKKEEPKKEAPKAKGKADAKKAPPAKGKTRRGELNDYGHVLGTMAADVDKMFEQGATKDKIVKMLMEKHGRTEVLASRKVIDHANHLHHKGFPVVVDEKTGKFQFKAKK